MSLIFFLKLRTDDLLSLLIGQDVYSNVSANVPADLAIAAEVTNSICRRRSRPEEGRWLLTLFAKGKGNIACNFDLYSHMEHRSSSIALRSRQLLCVKVCYAIMLTQDRERKRENVGANHLFKYVLWSAFCRARRASPPYALSLWVRRLGGGLSLPHRSRRRILYIKITPAETSYIYTYTELWLAWQSAIWRQISQRIIAFYEALLLWDVYRSTSLCSVYWWFYWIFFSLKICKTCQSSRLSHIFSDRIIKHTHQISTKTWRVSHLSEHFTN